MHHVDARPDTTRDAGGSRERAPLRTEGESLVIKSFRTNKQGKLGLNLSLCVLVYARMH